MVGVMEVQFDSGAKPKLRWEYKLLIGASVAITVAIAIWLGVRYGSAASNMSATTVSTSTPSYMPAITPSPAPTFTPTGPSPAPTFTPTGPSAAPTAGPTRPPTAAPSAALIIITSAGPSLTPSAAPLGPTRLPTAMPVSPPVVTSAAPSAAPSLGPTRSPTTALLPTPSVAPSISRFLYLDTTQLVNFSSATSWNITQISHGKNASLHQLAVDPVTNSGKVLKVNYPRLSYKPAALPVGGIGVYSTPASIFPAKSVRFSYQIYFPSSFNPNKGGKLPGLFLGKTGADGGKHIPNGASCRLMFRAFNPGSKSFMAEAYVYIASNQSASYKAIPGIVLDPVDGDSLWRGQVNFNIGSWNTVNIVVKANTVTNGAPDYNGFLNLTINSVSRTFSKLVYTTALTPINGVTFTTFFGGTDITWASPVFTSSYFKNVILEKLL